jgi:hypothetical protein
LGFQDLLFQILTIAISAVVSGGIFWIGLMLPWGRLEEFSSLSPKAVPGPVGSAEDIFLAEGAGFRMIRSHFRPASIGSIIFGRVAVMLGTSITNLWRASGFLQHLLRRDSL